MRSSAYPDAILDTDERPIASGVVTRTGGSDTPPCIMLVRLDEDRAELCASVVDPVLVIQVRHPLPACERMSVTRPWVVVIGATVRHEDQKRIRAAAERIDAEVLVLSGDRGTVTFARVLTDAMARAERKRAGEGGPRFRWEVA